MRSIQLLYATRLVTATPLFVWLSFNLVEANRRTLKIAELLDDVNLKMVCSRVSLMLLAALLGCLMRLTHSAAVLKLLGTRGHRHARSAPQVNQPWPCPHMTCRPIPKHCAMVEVVVFDNGPYTCQSCPYCLDHPGFLNSRRNRRSVENEAAQLVVDAPWPNEEVIDDLLSELLEIHGQNEIEPQKVHHSVAKREVGFIQPIIQNALCERMECPSTFFPKNCQHPGYLDGYLRGTKCISCQACLDVNTRQ